MICSLGHVLCASLLPSQPSIPPGSLNWVPASAGVKAGMSPLSVGRWHCRNSEACCILLYPVTFLYFYISLGCLLGNSVLSYCNTQMRPLTQTNCLPVCWSAECVHNTHLVTCISVDDSPGDCVCIDILHGWDDLPRPTVCVPTETEGGTRTRRFRVWREMFTRPCTETPRPCARSGSMCLSVYLRVTSSFVKTEVWDLSLRLKVWSKN